MTRHLFHVRRLILCETNQLPSSCNVSICRGKAYLKNLSLSALLVARRTFPYMLSSTIYILVTLEVHISFVFFFWMVYTDIQLRLAIYLFEWGVVLLFKVIKGGKSTRDTKYIYFPLKQPTYTGKFVWALTIQEDERILSMNILTTLYRSLLFSKQWHLLPLLLPLLYIAAILTHSCYTRGSLIKYLQCTLGTVNVEIIAGFIGCRVEIL